jgi:uncharacterized repeat protein (TIGR03837 family)
MNSLPQASGSRRWDIFCVVVDNFGDIGVCWRLARQLAAEHGCLVRLWVDDLAAFSRLCPEIALEQPVQVCSEVEIRVWQPAFPDVEPADVVIEAFACDLPASYVEAMARRRVTPCWINLEYLSAESWVADCHGLPSPHPKLPLTKIFMIPGFDKRSAGLLREQSLLDRHRSFTPAAWWPSAGGAPAHGQLSISLFAYENIAVGALLDAWSAGKPSVLCLAPESRVLDTVAAAFGKALVPGDTITREKLELRVLPFVRQEAYDDLLLACDINFVRGEDSLVRAIWAGKPFVWHIYRQEGDVHFVKLEAFLDRYCAGLSAPAASALRRFWLAWNKELVDVAVWPAFIAVLPELREHTQRWRDQLAEQVDLASFLAEFCEKTGQNQL